MTAEKNAIGDSNRTMILIIRAVTVPLIPFPVRFGSVFQQKPRFRFGSVFSYLLTILDILNRESTNAVNGNINLGYTYIS